MEYTQLELDTAGYSQYKRRFCAGNYDDNVLRNILEHRDLILKKYVECEDRKIARLIGMGIGNGLFVPLTYDGCFLDSDDVFAVSYVSEYDFRAEKETSEKYILFTLFTNDPYLPVLPIVYIQKLSIWDRLLKKNNNDFIEIIKKYCHKLKYPILPAAELEAIVREEYSTRGKMKKTLMLEQIYDAQNGIGMFEPEIISAEFGGMTQKILKQYKYDFV